MTAASADDAAQFQPRRTGSDHTTHGGVPIMQHSSATLVLDEPIPRTSINTIDRRVRRPHVPSPQTSWLPWAGVRRPATTRDEASFVDDLQARAHRPPSHTRPRRTDVTTVLNALRGGLTVDQLFDLAPGADATRLLVAHADLEARRVRSAAAWRHLVAIGTAQALDEFGPAAGLLLPVPVDRIARVACSSAEAIGEVARRLDRAVEHQRYQVMQIERALDADAVHPDDATALGRLLHDGTPDAISGRVDFLPDRVGLLNSTRVAALLEDHDSRHHGGSG